MTEKVSKKIRTIITQDAEVDDRNSLRHFMFYANEVELQGIVQTSSMFHWIGVPGIAKKSSAGRSDFEYVRQNGSFDAPYRWPGTDWMYEVADDYEKDYPNLCKHKDGYPSPDEIRSIIKVGNIGYEGEMDNPTEGSELIKDRILDDDDRILYLQVWGGTNTIARALFDIEREYSENASWPELHKRLSEKIVITACGEQDQTYRTYIAEHWPKIAFVKTLQMSSYAYPWLSMPEGDSKDCLCAEFMRSRIVNGKSALTSGYCTWLDGHYYSGEKDIYQFGSNERIFDEYFEFRDENSKRPESYDFLSEGDSPTFLCLIDWGFRTLEDFGNGGISGRYEKRKEYNSKGEELNIWDVTSEEYTGRDGSTVVAESMWRYVADIQRDFAARISWASNDSAGVSEYPPELEIAEGTDFKICAGGSITLHIECRNLNGFDTDISAWVYREASGKSVQNASINCCEDRIMIVIPQSAKIGDKLHVIVKAQSQGENKLTHYCQIIITIWRQEKSTILSKLNCLREAE